MAAAIDKIITVIIIGTTGMIKPVQINANENIQWLLFQNQNEFFSFLPAIALYMYLSI